MLGEGYEVRCSGGLKSKELDAFAKVLETPARLGHVLGPALHRTGSFEAEGMGTANMAKKRRLSSKEGEFHKTEFCRTLQNSGT